MVGGEERERETGGRRAREREGDGNWEGELIFRAEDHHDRG